ncbi:carboxypeptidase regulatory-like domain-containing protein, partial [bacterium]|nr:carboxypeptidase regulatory-like domain-containing protein [bacterium]
MPEVRGKLWGVILFLLVAPLFAIEIIGSVRDATTGLPVAEASVTLGSRFTSTDASGRFSLSNAIAGEYRIVVTHVAYNKFTTTIRLHDGANP